VFLLRHRGRQAGSHSYAVNVRLAGGVPASLTEDRNPFLVTGAQRGQYFRVSEGGISEQSYLGR
jgi:hypothetical protein